MRTKTTQPSREVVAGARSRAAEDDDDVPIARLLGGSGGKRSSDASASASAPSKKPRQPNYKAPPHLPGRVCARERPAPKQRWANIDLRAVDAATGGRRTMQLRATPRSDPSDARVLCVSASTTLFGLEKALGVAFDVLKTEYVAVTQNGVGVEDAVFQDVDARNLLGGMPGAAAPKKQAKLLDFLNAHDSAIVWRTPLALGAVDVVVDGYTDVYPGRVKKPLPRLVAGGGAKVTRAFADAANEKLLGGRAGGVERFRRERERERAGEGEGASDAAARFVEQNSMAEFYRRQFEPLFLADGRPATKGVRGEFEIYGKLAPDDDEDEG